MKNYLQNLDYETKNLINNERGITLIALIITIIILVVLAAVSINAAYNSGIINYSVNGTQNYIVAANAENTAIQNAESIMVSAIDALNESNKSTLFTAKLSSNQVLDCWRTPDIPGAGDSVYVYNFNTACKYDGTRNSLSNNHYFKFVSLGTISTLENSNLKSTMQSSYPDKDYPVVRLDEFDENDNNIGRFSQGGILYLLSEERQIYLFVAAMISSEGDMNSYGYLICLTEEEAESLIETGSATMIASGIVNSL